jgi:hypothetical protein
MIVRSGAEITDLTLEVDSRRAHQITVVIGLLQRRHWLRAHHSQNGLWKLSYGERNNAGSASDTAMREKTGKKERIERARKRKWLQVK